MLYERYLLRRRKALPRRPVVTRYGPWIQPDDTEAAPQTMWWRTSTEAQGTVATRADATAQTASTQAVKDGTGASSMIAGLTTVSSAQNAGVGWLEVSSDIVALGQISLMAPYLPNLDFAPIPPDETPASAVTYEYEEPEGTPVDGTIRIFGELAIVSASDRPLLKGATLYRLNEAEYGIDGLDRPTAEWDDIVAASPIALAITAPSASTVWETRSFNLTGLSPDGSGYIVFGLVSDWLYDDWQYPLGSIPEGNTVSLYNVAPVSPPSAGTLPYFTQTYTPPRYRFVYEQDPPLRQFPRADNLVGTGGVRQRSAGSRQASNRQGWNGAYLRAGWAAG